MVWEDSWLCCSLAVEDRKNVAASLEKLRQHHLPFSLSLSPISSFKTLFLFYFPAFSFIFHFVLPSSSPWELLHPSASSSAATAMAAAAAAASVCSSSSYSSLRPTFHRQLQSEEHLRPSIYLFIVYNRRSIRRQIDIHPDRLIPRRLLQCRTTRGRQRKAPLLATGA